MSVNVGVTSSDIFATELFLHPVKNDSFHISKPSFLDNLRGKKYSFRNNTAYLRIGRNDLVREISELSVYNFLKRLFDICFGLVGCILLLPVCIVVKIVFVATGDFDSIFFTQNRIGLNGNEFKIFKFRSMVHGADAVLDKYLADNPEAAKEYSINKKLEYDPRISKVGAILRKTSIDEFPQFINILIGNMSIIGNRPYLPREKDDMDVFYNDIVKTRPALTGLWQVSGRSDTSFDERLRLERYYSNNCSYLMDLKIFFKTFSTVITGKGAK